MTRNQREEIYKPSTPCVSWKTRHKQWLENSLHRDFWSHPMKNIWPNEEYMNTLTYEFCVEGQREEHLSSHIFCSFATDQNWKETQPTLASVMPSTRLKISVISRLFSPFGFDINLKTKAILWYKVQKLKYGLHRSETSLLKFIDKQILNA